MRYHTYVFLPGHGRTDGCTMRRVWIPSHWHYGIGWTLWRCTVPRNIRALIRQHGSIYVHPINVRHIKQITRWTVDHAVYIAADLLYTATEIIYDLLPQDVAVRMRNTTQRILQHVKGMDDPPRQRVIYDHPIADGIYQLLTLLNGNDDPNHRIYRIDDVIQVARNSCYSRPNDRNKWHRRAMEHFHDLIS